MDEYDDTPTEVESPDVPRSGYIPDVLSLDILRLPVVKKLLSDTIRMGQGKVHLVAYTAAREKEERSFVDSCALRAPVTRPSVCTSTTALLDEISGDWYSLDQDISSLPDLSD